MTGKRIGKENRRQGREIRREMAREMNVRELKESEKNETVDECRVKINER